MIYNACFLAEAFIQLLAGHVECIYIFSEGFPKVTEPLTPEMLAVHSIHSTTGLLHCGNMFHLIESDTKSIIIYSKFLLANLDTKTAARDFSQRYECATGCPFVPAVII